MHNAAPVGWEVLTVHTFYALRQPEPHRHAPTLSSFHNKRQPENAFDTFSGCLLLYISTPARITDTKANTQNAVPVGCALAAHAFYVLRQPEPHRHALTLPSFHNKRQPENASDTFSGCLSAHISTPAYIAEKTEGADVG